ncbi:MAG: lasso RiPP family leader peptide-containing protein [Pseudonocardiaceae bacterium]
MDIDAEYDTEVPSKPREVYEPPILDEIGEFVALTGLNNVGSYADAGGYYDL